MAVMSKAGANQLQRNDSRVAAMKKHGLQALNTREQFAREICLHWDEAKQSFLLIGEALYLAKEKLQHGEFEEMIRNDLPFERTVCHQLRRVYEAVATNRLREEELPAAYSTAYKITTLTDGELERARASQLLRPDLTRAEIMAFKKSLHPNQPVPDLVKVRKLREHYRKLREQMRAMEEELQALGIDPDSIDDEEEDGVGEGEIIEGEAVKVK
jgi:hypothetical protein